MLNLQTLGSGSKGNCYIIHTQEKTLILECGLTYKKIAKAINFNFANLSGILVTHSHKDHSRSIKDFCEKGVDIFCTTGTVVDLSLKDPRINIIQPEKQFKLDGFTILPFNTEHDATESVGFLIYHKEFGKLLFATDTFYIRYNFKGLDYIMIETNYSMEILKRNIEKNLIPKIMRKRLLTSHLSLENTKKFLAATDLKNVKKIIQIGRAHV